MDDEKQVFDMFIEDQKKQHEKNMVKIRNGIKVNIFLPLVFLITCFISNGSKLIFLILWIVSLFGIAFYLVYVEYTDYKNQEKLRKFGVIEHEENEVLIGNIAIEANEVVNATLDQVDEKIDKTKEAINRRVSEAQEKIGERIEDTIQDIKDIKVPIFGGKTADNIDSANDEIIIADESDSDAKEVEKKEETKED